MELLASPNEQYLLPTSLNTMHEECIEWLKGLRAWKERMSSLYYTIHNQDSMRPFPSENVAVVDKEIIEIVANKLDKLKKSVHKHEAGLRLVFKDQYSQDDQAYRNVHAMIQNELNGIHTLIQEFNERVNELVKDKGSISLLN